MKCEVHAYPAAGKYAVVNNSNEPQVTAVTDGDGKTETVKLDAAEILWKQIRETGAQPSNF